MQQSVTLLEKLFLHKPKTNQRGTSSLEAPDQRDIDMLRIVIVNINIEEPT